MEARRSRRRWGVGGNGKAEAALQAADVDRRTVQVGAEVGECVVGGHGLWQFNLSILVSKYDPDSPFPWRYEYFLTPGYLVCSLRTLVVSSPNWLTTRTATFWPGLRGKGRLMWP